MQTAQLEKILNVLAQDESFISFLNDLYESEVVFEETIYDRKELDISKAINELSEYIKYTQKEFGQDSIQLKGYNGIYPLINLPYPSFEPNINTYTVNFKQVCSNEALGFELGLYEKLNKEKPAIMAIGLPYRNECVRFMIWIVE